MLERVYVGRRYREAQGKLVTRSVGLGEDGEDGDLLMRPYALGGALLPELDSFRARTPIFSHQRRSRGSNRRRDKESGRRPSLGIAYSGPLCTSSAS